MNTEEKNLRFSVTVSESATPTQRKLAEWLSAALEELEVESCIQEEEAVEEPPAGQEQASGQTESPLTPSKEQTAEDLDEFDLDDESDDETDEKDTVSPKERTQGFLIGMFTAWIVTGSGVLLYRVSKWMINYVSYLTGIPFDILVGLCILSIAALLLLSRVRQFATFLKDWFDFDY